MTEERWRLYKRPARWRRRVAVRGSQYDGSRWVLHSTYAEEEDALKALDNLTRKSHVGATFHIETFKLLPPGQGLMSTQRDRKK